MTTPKIHVSRDENGTFACRVNDEPPAHAHTEREAVFWAGWWHGRRQLEKSVSQLVSGGERMQVHDTWTSPPPTEEGWEQE